MLELIEGGFCSSADEFLKNEILSLAKAKKQVYMLVPEQQSVLSEGEMMASVPPECVLNFEVTNFTRLADTVYRRVGGLASDIATDGKEALIMWKTLSTLSPALSMTDGVKEISHGLVSKALAAEKEMKSLSILPEELISASENEALKDNKRLKNKLSDLAKIMALKKKLTDEKYSLSKDECEKLAEKLAEHPDIFMDAHFFLTGFTSFTEPQYKVLTKLIERSEVSVRLVLPKDSSGFEFSEIRKTEEKLKRIASKAGSQIILSRHDNPLSDRDGVFENLAGLFHKNFEKLDNESLQNIEHKVRIFEADTPYEECNFIASDIKAKVMQGDTWRDFAIIARDSKKYDGILDTLLASAKIPAFISRRRDINSSDAVKVIYSAFAVTEGGFRAEDLLSYAKCSYSGIDADACCEFELYIEKWKLNGKDFTDGKEWKMNTEGYSERSPKNLAETLARINLSKDTVVSPLLKFKSYLSSAVTVKDYAAALISFLTDIRLEEKILEKQRSLLLLGERALSESYDGIWQIICSALDDIAEVLGDTEISAKDFLSQLKVLFSAINIGRIPAHRDEVTVGSADMLRLSGKKHVYLIGVNDGEFPLAVSDNAYFNDKDKALLGELGLSAEPVCLIDRARELFFISRAAALAKNTLTLLYSLKKADLSVTKRSGIIDRICEISDGKISPVKISSIPPIEKIYSVSTGMEYITKEEVAKALMDLGFTREVEISKKKISNESIFLERATSSKMYPDTLSLSQTRIDTFVNCPFSYFLRYNIKLSENEKAEFDARNIGTFIHAILEYFFSEIRKNGRDISSITQEEISELVGRSAEKFLAPIIETSGISTKRTSLLVDRLCRFAMPIVEGLCDELKDCSFIPEYFELKIEREKDGMPNAVKFKSDDGGDVYIYGSIDRVDTYKKDGDVYVRVIDYKTGSKNFSLSDIDEGRNLQMFLYLKAITDTENKKFKDSLGVGKDGRVIPAGVIYVKTNMNDVTIPRCDEEEASGAVKKRQERCGVILDDTVSISAMNKDYLPVKFKQSGEIDPRSKNRLYTYDGWEDINKRISDKVSEISSDIKKGHISPSPKSKHAPCEWCKFKSVCRTE